MQARFLTKLAERKEKGSLRSLSLFDGLIDFCSNDYLGMARNEAPSSSCSGSTGSRLISGNSPEAESSEQILAGFFGSEAALIFNSGYDANVGIFSSLPQKGDTVLYDELIHASVRDGIRLSHARSFSFRHNDLEDLKKKAARTEGTVFVAIESLYSMDGDLAPLREITEWCESTGALLIVDEAHTGGVFGEGGRGLMHNYGLESRCFARLITFGKAYGSHGAVICGSSVLREFLINFARSFIYTTALPGAHYQHLAAKVEEVSVTAERKKLRENIVYFRELAANVPLISDPESPIQIIPIPDVSRCLRIAESLRSNGLAVKAILPPTVPEDGQRLRICLHSFNTRADIRKLIELVEKDLG